MTTLFRLEFSEEQQVFHHNHGHQEPNTNGFITIFEHCEELEAQVFLSLLKFLKEGKLTNKDVLDAKRSWEKHSLSCKDTNW
jgi:hypothetical protein